MADIDRIARAVVEWAFRKPRPPVTDDDLRGYPGGIPPPEERTYRVATVTREFYRAWAQKLCYERDYPPEVIERVYELIDERLATDTGQP